MLLSTRTTKRPRSRAPKKTRNLAETRAAILEAAFEEIHARGFHASSIDAILERTNLTKGALFHQFASKLELGYAVVDEVLVPMTLTRWVTPLAAFDDPLEGILVLVERNVTAFPQAMLDLGCPLANLIQEMSNVDPQFRRRLRRCIEVWIDGVEAHIERGRASGHVRRSVKPRAVAEYVVMTLEGVFAVIKGMRDKSVVPTLVSSMRAHFASLSRASSSPPRCSSTSRS
jgi:TetR/AcrR family transcriptional regulator, transcriptional repressor for nem operon